MKKSLLLEAIGSNLDEAKVVIEAALRLSFTARESYYHGGKYFRADLDGVGVILQENFLENDGKLTEAEFPNVGYLIYIDGAEDSVDQISALLKAPTNLLRTSSY